MTPDTLSLLTDAEVTACQPPGMVPDPETAAKYVSGISDGGWHAVPRDRAEHAAEHGLTYAAAICGAQARTEAHMMRGTYDRTAWPFEYPLCQVCAWAMAMITNSVEREIKLLTPGSKDTARLAELGVDSLLAVKIARAVLASGDAQAEIGTSHPDMEAVTLLAHVTRHAPGLTIDRDCHEGDCCHSDEGGSPGGEAACWGCSLVAGEWAGTAGFEGQLISRCHVKPPCSVLTTIAKAYGITAATSPEQAAALGRKATAGG